MSADTPKAVHEALCAAQGALHQWARDGRDERSVPIWAAQIQTLLNEVERHRPVGSNGKHGEHRHTATCGCEGHCGPWSIELRPNCEAR